MAGAKALLSGRFGLGITNCRPTAEVVAGVRTAEALGAEIAFVSEDINCRDAFQLCSLAAQQTTHIRLATGVVNPYTRNPTSLAMAIATLDEISGGRSRLGLGTSSPSLISQQMGIPRGNPVGVMKETTEIVRSLLRGDTVTYSGQRFTYARAHLEVLPTQPTVPVFYAAMGPRMLRLAGTLADGVLLNVGASVEYIRWAVGQIHAGCKDAGRDPGQVTIAAWLTSYVTDDYASGVARARLWLASMLSIPGQGELLLEHAGADASILTGIRAHHSAYPHTGDREAAAQYVPDEVAERLTLIGNRERVLERVAQYRDAGVQVPVLSLAALTQLADPAS